ncbi:MAG: class I SAM-dependent methyltransferase [Pirellulaceae bacterium]|nr:class I SAM-dependent methyltransferase [Pirellulaceae bacterium]
MVDESIDREQIKSIYQEWFRQPTLLSAHDAQLQYLLAILPEDQSVAILDAGCGDGRYSQYLRSRGYANIMAVDLFAKSPVDDLPYRSASIDALPFENESFDVVFSNSVVYYADPPGRALAEFARVLKPGGTLMFTAHTKWSLFTLQRVIKRDVLKSKAVSHLTGVKFYSAEYYNRALRAQGFEVCLRDGWRCSFLAYPTYLYASAILNKVAGFRLPEIRPFMSRARWIGKLKSEFAYHSVFIAKKP